MRFWGRDSLWSVRSLRLAEGAREVLDFFLPPACAGCGGPAEAGADPVCRDCRLGLPPVPFPHCSRCRAPVGTGRAPSCYECLDWPDELVGAQALCMLESPARELVHALKYQGWRRVGACIGKEMAEKACDAVRRADIVVPVPTSARNVRRRGYNQAHEIASALAAGLGLPLAGCLERRRQRGTQTALNPTQRRANVSNAFVLKDGSGSVVAGRRIVLVDDVITTGATVQSAARALGLAGAGPASVFVYAFARTVPLSLETT